MDGFVEVSSIAVGCAEPIERVRDEIDVSGDNVEGAMLSGALYDDVVKVSCMLRGWERRSRCSQNFFRYRLHLLSVRWV